MTLAILLQLQRKRKEEARKQRLKMSKRRREARKEEDRWTLMTATFVQVRKLRPLFC